MENIKFVEKCIEIEEHFGEMLLECYIIANVIPYNSYVKYRKGIRELSDQIMMNMSIPDGLEKPRKTLVKSYFYGIFSSDFYDYREVVFSTLKSISDKNELALKIVTAVESYTIGEEENEEN